MGRYDLMESGKKNSIPGGLEQRDADSDGEQKRPHQPPPGCLRSGPVRSLFYARPLLLFSAHDDDESMTRPSSTAVPTRLHLPLPRRSHRR